MELFTVTPGDRTSYTVLFGRLPTHIPILPQAVVFGFGEAGDALITVFFETEQIEYNTFMKLWETARHARPTHTLDYLKDAAYAMFAALTANEKDSMPPSEWHEDWRQGLPTGLMGLRY